MFQNQQILLLSVVFCGFPSDLRKNKLKGNLPLNVEKQQQ